MHSSLYITAFSALIPLSFGAVPTIFDAETMNDVLLAAIPGLEVPPLSTQFGGCTSDEVRAIEQAWDDAMNKVLPAASNALAQPPEQVSQIDNIFNALYRESTSRSNVKGVFAAIPTGAALIPEADEFDEMIQMNGNSPPVAILFHCTDSMWDTFRKHGAGGDAVDAGDSDGCSKY
jgi:hypothetical protein